MFIALTPVSICKHYAPPDVTPSQTRNSCHASCSTPGSARMFRRARCSAIKDSRDSELSDLEDMLEEDLKRWEARKPQGAAPPGRTPQAEGSSSSGLKEQLDKVLIADFFFICIALAWLAAGVAEKAILSSTNLIDTWYPLWPLVFQPAIGVLMLGALVSGAAGWLQRQKQA